MVTDVWGKLRGIGKPVEAAMDLARERGVRLPEVSQRKEGGRPKSGGRGSPPTPSGPRGTTRPWTRIAKRQKEKSAELRAFGDSVKATGPRSSVICEPGTRPESTEDYRSMITQEMPAVLPVEPGNIPEALTERRQWVCWALQQRDDAFTKVPFTPGTSDKASATDLMTWRTFSEALEAYERQEPMRYSGVGFCFCSADRFCGVDLDDCRDPGTGELAAWAEKIVGRFPQAYVEASVSGTGVHVIAEGKVRGGGMRRRRVEAYGRDRFFALTGHII
jgi:hypothetical protein